MKEITRKYKGRIIGAILIATMIIGSVAVSLTEPAAYTFKDPDKALKDETWGYGKDYENVFYKEYSSVARKWLKKYWVKNIGAKEASAAINGEIDCLTDSKTSKVAALAALEISDIYMFTGYASKDKLAKLVNAGFFADHVGIFSRLGYLPKNYKYKGKYGYKYNGTIWVFESSYKLPDVVKDKSRSYSVGGLLKGIEPITKKTVTTKTKSFNLDVEAKSWGKMTIKSSNPKVATMDKNGKVTVKGIGKTKITIKTAKKKPYKAGKTTITITVKPTKVKGFSVKTSNNSAALSWKAVKKAKTYEVQRKDASEAYKTIATVSGTKYIDDTITDGHQYSYRVRAAGNGVKGDFSKEKTILTGDAIEVPTIKTMTLTKLSPSLFKNEADKDVARYQIILSAKTPNDRSITHFEWEIFDQDKVVESGVSAINEIVDKTVKGRTIYKSRIRLVKDTLSGNRYSDWSDFEYRMSAPGAKTIKANSDETVTITLDPVKGAEKYRIYMYGGHYTDDYLTDNKLWEDPVYFSGTTYTVKKFPFEGKKVTFDDCGECFIKIQAISDDGIISDNLTGYISPYN